MFITFQTKEFTVNDIFKQQYHFSEVNGKKILKIEFIEEHNGEVVYMVELENGIRLLAFGDEIKGG